MISSGGVFNTVVEVECMGEKDSVEIVSKVRPACVFAFSLPPSSFSEPGTKNLI